MDTGAILRGARTAAANAKDGTLNLNGVTYTFTFDHTAWHYTITAPDGSELMTYNTKSLKQARQWLREYFLN
jgi:hypothetical protein